MKIIDFLNICTNYAKDYREEANNIISHNNPVINGIKEDEIIEQRIIDAILCDFINYIGMHQAHPVDFALYTKDLLDPHKRQV
jgi:hypothetical protein